MHEKNVTEVMKSYNLVCFVVKIYAASRRIIKMNNMEINQSVWTELQVSADF